MTSEQQHDYGSDQQLAAFLDAHTRDRRDGMPFDVILVGSPSADALDLAALGDRMHAAAAAPGAAPRPSAGMRSRVLAHARTTPNRRRRAFALLPGSAGGWGRRGRVLAIAAAALVLLVPTLAVAQSETGAGRAVRSAADRVGVLPPWLAEHRRRDVARERARHREDRRADRRADDVGRGNAGAASGSARGASEAGDDHHRRGRGAADPADRFDDHGGHGGDDPAGDDRPRPGSGSGSGSGPRPDDSPHPEDRPDGGSGGAGGTSGGSGRPPRPSGSGSGSGSGGGGGDDDVVAPPPPAPSGSSGGSGSGGSGSGGSGSDGGGGGSDDPPGSED